MRTMSICILMAWLSLTAALCDAQRLTGQSDTFDGSLINTARWNVSTPLGGSTVTQNGALFVTSPTDTDGKFSNTPFGFSDTPGLFGPGAGVGSRYKLSGDFDVQVDFSGFSVPPSNTEFTQAFFNVYQDAGNQIHIKRIQIGRAHV